MDSKQQWALRCISYTAFLRMNISDCGYGSSRYLSFSSTKMLNGLYFQVVQEKEKKKYGKVHVMPSISDEFFGVYCLLSRSSNRYFKVFEVFVAVVAIL